ncbi:hypothetical protein HMPREF1508_0565 [Shuttleworthella sp. MSX8B]|nr:hypothetical protein HMPREF1508_0565 [Shuttleworthia sp. MSX8B]
MKSNAKNRISALLVFASRRKREQLGEAALRRRYFTMGVVKNVLGFLLGRSMSGVSPNMAEPPDTLPADSK